jgi:nucleoid-associated protein YgaU
MSVATEFLPAVSVPVGARQVSRAAVSSAPALPASPPRLRLVPPVADRPPVPRRRADGARRGAPRVRRRPASCPPPSAQPAVSAEVGIGAGQFEAPPVRLTRRGLFTIALGVALAGGLLLLTAHLSAGSPAPRHAVSPAAVVTVQPGDTLWSIAGQVAPGRDPRRVIEQLRRSNHLDTVSLTPGQTLKVG